MSATAPGAQRWSLNAAAAEFGIDRRTLAKRLSGAGVAASEDQKFSTADILAALFGDIDGAKLRETLARAEKVELENAITRREYILVADALEIAQRFCHAIRQKFLATSLPAAEKNDLLKEIERLASTDFTEDPDADEEDDGK